MIKNASRLLLAGTGSGCGKTTVVCALLQALKNRGEDIAAFKCGPDYIDPMFHSEIIGAPSTNVDLFFSGEDRLRSLFVRHAGDLNLIEGVMGFYDGIAMDSDRASSHHVSRVLDAPVVLVISGRGMALSAAAVVKGYLELRRPNNIVGVIFNNISPMSYPALKSAVERECPVKVYGYLPPCPECALESRHLGLVTAQEIDDLKQKMQWLARQAEKSLDIDGLVQLMRSQSAMEAEVPQTAPMGRVRIAVARDKAFCFYYQDNLECIEALGGEIVYFSPLKDASLPECDGLVLGGGYPELYLEALSENESMRQSIQNAIQGGLPTIAECGGFMYLTQAIYDYPMVGVVPTRCFNAGKLRRFGYSTLTATSDNLILAQGESIQAHEFHYWDAEDPGEAFKACKPSGRGWDCAYATDSFYGGYPHLYLPSQPHAAQRFIEKCLERKSNT